MKWYTINVLDTYLIYDNITPVKFTFHSFQPIYINKTIMITILTSQKLSVGWFDLSAALSPEAFEKHCQTDSLQMT